jgi:hypothetical protein
MLLAQEERDVFRTNLVRSALQIQEKLLQREVNVAWELACLVERDRLKS